VYSTTVQQFVAVSYYALAQRVWQQLGMRLHDLQACPAVTGTQPCRAFALLQVSLPCAIRPFGETACCAGHLPPPFLSPLSNPTHSGCTGSRKFQMSMWAGDRRPMVARRWVWLARSVQAAATTPRLPGTQHIALTTCAVQIVVSVGQGGWEELAQAANNQCPCAGSCCY
jgi:hypothetical protein